MTVYAETDRIVVLCERLAHATRTGSAKWRVDSDDRFVWQQPEHASVSIGSRDKDGEPPYEIALFNANGDKVEELTSQLVGEDEPAVWNDSLAVLYRAARRSALGADELIDTLIAALPTPSDETVGSFERRRE
jgi:hypothetical protein